MRCKAKQRRRVACPVAEEDVYKRQAQRLKPPDNSTPFPSTNSDTSPSTNAAPNTLPGPDSEPNGPSDLENMHLNNDDLSDIDKKVHDAFEKALKQDAQTLSLIHI